MIGSLVSYARTLTAAGPPRLHTIIQHHVMRAGIEECNMHGLTVALDQHGMLVRLDPCGALFTYEAIFR